MHDPIDPGLPIDLARILAGLTWVQTKLGPDGIWLGVLKNGAGATKHMGPETTGAVGTAKWSFDLLPPSGGVPAVLMTQATATLLLTGVVQANGTINDVAGANHKVQLFWNGVDMTAKAVP